MRLGEMLVQAGKLTAAQLREALESQVIHGGRLGTNLVELGMVDEKDLAAALGQQHRVQHASGKMEPDPRALELVAPEFADEHDLLPMRVDPTRLSIAVTNPQDLATFDNLAFMTGRRVIPVVVPEFRMNQLLRAHCKAFRPLRALDLEGAKKQGAVAELGAPAAGGSELMSEDEFQSLYAQVLSGGAAAPAAPAQPTLAPAAPTPRVPSMPSVPAAGSAPAAPPPTARAPQLPSAVAAAQPLGVSGSQVPPPPSRSATPPTPVPPASPEPILLDTPKRVTPEPALPAQPPPAPTPIGFQDAQAKLSASHDREEIAQTVLRFALGKWKRALLLSVQRDYVLGWHGMGSGVRDAAVRRIAVPLRKGNTFRLVRDTRAHFVGPLKRDAATQVFAQLLGGGFPTTAVMLPLLVRGKVVHLLYVDNGPDQLTTPDVGELLILSQSVARSYEVLLQQRARV